MGGAANTTKDKETAQDGAVEAISAKATSTGFIWVTEGPRAPRRARPNLIRKST